MTDHGTTCHRWPALVVAWVLLSLIVSGCGGEGSTPGPDVVSTDAADVHCVPATALALVVGVHRNMPKPDVPAPLGCLLRSTILAGHPVAVIVVDGNPRLVLPPTRFPLNTRNKVAMSDDVNAAVRTVVGSVHGASARADGSDLLAAVGTAADALRSLPSGNTVPGRPLGDIVVLDSGLSDRGDLSFTVPGMLGAAPAEVADALRGRLPDLHGFRAELVGMGYTSPPQSALGVAERTQVADVWRAVLARAGAEVHLNPLPRSGPPPDTTFRVTPLPVAVTPVDPCQFTVYTDASPVSFARGTTTLRDEAAALVTLRPLAGWLAGDRDRHVTLTGTASSEGDAAVNTALSAGRAATVRDLLVRLGASSEQISVVGKGYIASPPDRRSDGGLDPAKAALNRSVRVETSGC